jgi:hypothetical protein
MNLFKYYRKAVIYPSFFILFFGIINSIIENYNTEWQFAKSAIIMSISTSLIFCLLICVLSLPIFLNKLEKLNKNLIWNILVWFLLPFVYISIIWIYDIENRIKFEFGFGDDFFYLLIKTIPFVIGLSWTFIKFRQEIAAAYTV